MLKTAPAQRLREPEITENTHEKILTHTNYNETDYKYLKFKGWTNKEILQRWDEEAMRGKGPVTWDNKEARKKLNDLGLN